MDGRTMAAGKRADLVLKSDGCRNLTGIRNRIINVIRYGERLQNSYVSSLNTKLPGFSGIRPVLS